MQRRLDETLQELQELRRGGQTRSGDDDLNKSDLNSSKLDDVDTPGGEEGSSELAQVIKLQRDIRSRDDLIAVLKYEAQEYHGETEKLKKEMEELKRQAIQEHMQKRAQVENANPVSERPRERRVRQFRVQDKSLGSKVMAFMLFLVKIIAIVVILAFFVFRFKTLTGGWKDIDELLNGFFSKW